MSDQTTQLSGSLTLSERLQMLKDLLYLPFVLVGAPFKRENKGRTLRRAAYDSVLRYVASCEWTLQQNLSLFGFSNSTEVYEAWSRKKGVEILTDEINEGAKLHWIGSRRYDHVLLWLHGGGFCLPAVPNQHLDFLSGIQTELANARSPVGVVMLAYSLTPASPFPTQIRQVTAGLNYLFTKGVSPSNLVLGGDSAGGNLVLQVLSHNLHPLPGIPLPNVSSPLAGVILLSQWASFQQDFPSFKKYDTRDIISCRTIARLASISLPGVAPGQEPWFEPMATDAAWWQGLDGMVSRILNTVGEVECLRDPIEEFAKTRLGPNIQDLTCLVEKNGVHTDFLCDIAVGEGRQSTVNRDVISWLQRTFINQ